MKPFFPGYMFAHAVGPSVKFFALWPRKAWNGKWIWFRKAWRQTMVVHGYLQGAGDSFFVYSTDYTKEHKNGQSTT